MSCDNDQFERELRDGLKGLSQRAGAGPSPEQVARRLRQRTTSRYLMASGALAATVIVVFGIAISLPRGASDSQMLSTTGKANQLSTAPLQRHAGRAEIELALRKYVDAAGLKGTLVIDKSPRDGLSYAFSGKVAGQTPLAVRANLELLFQRFDVVHVVLRSDMGW